MINIKSFDHFLMRRCVYCKKEGQENLFVLFGSWDDNPELDPEKAKDLVGLTVCSKTTYAKEGDLFKIISAESASPKLGTNCFSFLAEHSIAEHSISDCDRPSPPASDGRKELE